MNILSYKVSTKPGQGHVSMSVAAVSMVSPVNIVRNFGMATPVGAVTIPPVAVAISRRVRNLASPFDFERLDPLLRQLHAELDLSNDEPDEYEHESQ